MISKLIEKIKSYMYPFEEEFISMFYASILLSLTIAILVFCLVVLLSK